MFEMIKGRTFFQLSYCALIADTNLVFKRDDKRKKWHGFKSRGA